MIAVEPLNRAPFVLGAEASVYTRAEAGETRTVIVEPGRLYRICGSVDLLVDGVRILRRAPVMARFTAPRSRVLFCGKGFVTMTPSAREIGGASA